METLQHLIAQHPFFSGLQPEYLELITGCASNVRFDADSYIFHEGEEAQHFYLLRAGKVGLEVPTPDRGPMTIQTVGEGEMIGWSWLVPPYLWRFDARVLELTRAVALDATCLRKKCETDHHLGYELLKRLTVMMEERLQATRLQLLDFYGTHA